MSSGLVGQGPRLMDGLCFEHHIRAGCSQTSTKQRSQVQTGGVGPVFQVPFTACSHQAPARACRTGGGHQGAVEGSS